MQQKNEKYKNEKRKNGLLGLKFRLLGCSNLDSSGYGHSRKGSNFGVAGYRYESKLQRLL
jgi:hypothetical protein